VESFNSVLTAARAGADWAWERIYADLAPVVTGYLRGHGAAEPEDLAGETFLHVVRDLPRFEGDERAFRSWVFTIAHRRLIDDRRRRGRRPVTPGGRLDDRGLRGGRRRRGRRSAGAGGRRPRAGRDGRRCPTTSARCCCCGSWGT
jgi:DNA-directed RNA polymerase specialized sigma24 family protein